MLTRILRRFWQSKLYCYNLMKEIRQLELLLYGLYLHCLLQGKMTGCEFRFQICHSVTHIHEQNNCSSDHKRLQSAIFFPAHTYIVAINDA